VKQYKKNVIKAEDIDPRTVYFAHGKPCLIEHTPEPGWKRGKVLVVENKNGFYAIANFFDDTVTLIRLAVETNDFYFADYSGRPTLSQLPETYIAERHAQIEKARKDIEQAQQEIDTIKHFMDLVARGLVRPSNVTIYSLKQIQP
jgi:hypothetical protein